MLVDGGCLTSAHYMSNTLPIPRNKNDIAVCTALAGQLLGLQCIYMDAGSGAAHPISKGMISQVKKELSVPLIVGGGITTVATALNACDAGADMLVVGSAIERSAGKEGLIKELSDAIRDFA
jgi:putative glycerol-1-phosphate prenyltransferase